MKKTDGTYQKVMSLVRLTSCDRLYFTMLQSHVQVQARVRCSLLYQAPWYMVQGVGRHMHVEAGTPRSPG